MSLTVSVVIPNYNYGRFLGEAIESVLRQTVQPKEIIVVDDGSTDNSIEVASRYNVKIIEQPNSGVGVARNTGAAACSGDLIAFLDADDIWRENKLEKQLSVFNSDEKIGLVTCDMEEFSEEGRFLGVYRNNREEFSSVKMLCFRVPIVVSGSAVVYRRKVFEQLGGFDSRKEVHPSEDWEMFFRASLAFDVDFVESVLVDYRNHGNNGHLKISKFERAMNLVFEKVFSSCSPNLRETERCSRGELYRILAGSYFVAGAYREFIRSAFRSVRYNPSSLVYFFMYPARLLSRALPNGRR